MKSWQQKEPADERNQRAYRYKQEMRLSAADLDDLPNRDMVATIKYDGELNLAFFDGEKTTFANRYNRLREDMPSSDELTKILKQLNIKSAIFAGELYAVDTDGSKLSLGPVMHRIKKPSNKEEEDSVRYRVFDIIAIDNGLPDDYDYKTRCFLIDEIFKDGKYVRPVEFNTSLAGAKEMWAQVEKDKLEGLVVRTTNDKGKMMNIKVKVTTDVDLVVIGLKMGGKSWDREEAGALIVAWMDEDNVLRYAGSVGGGLRPKAISDFEKPWSFRSWWYNLGIEKGIEDRKVNGMWVRFVPPEHIITVRADDWVSGDRPAFQYQDGEYIQIENREAPVGQKPRMIGYREDKVVSPHDLRLEQIPKQ